MFDFYNPSLLFCFTYKSKNPPEVEDLTKKERVTLESVGAVRGHGTHSK